MMKRLINTILFISIACSGLGQSFLERGTSALKNGNNKEAITWFDWAIKADSLDAERYLLRGQAKRAIKQSESALEDFEKAVELNSNYGDAHFFKALAEFDIGKRDKAIESSTAALLFGTTQPIDARSNRAQIRKQLGQAELAILDYDTLIAFNGPDVSDHYFQRGQIKLQIQKRKSAIADFKEVVKRNPNNLQLTWDVGRLCYEIEDFKCAIEYYTKAIDRIDKKEPNLYLVRGEAFERLELYQNAISDYTSAINLNDKIAAAYFGRGQAKARSGDKKGACPDWVQAKQLGHAEAASVVNYNCEE